MGHPELGRNDANAWQALTSSPRARRNQYQLREQVCLAKKALSRDTSAEINLPDESDSRYLTVTREQFEWLSSNMRARPSTC